MSAGQRRRLDRHRPRADAAARAGIDLEGLPAAAGEIPSSFFTTTYAEVLWVYVSRVETDLLPRRYRSAKLYFRAIPRVSPRHLTNTHYQVLSELASEPQNFKRLQHAIGLRKEVLATALSVLYHAGSITTDPARATKGTGRAGGRRRAERLAPDAVSAERGEPALRTRTAASARFPSRWTCPDPDGSRLEHSGPRGRHDVGHLRAAQEFQLRQARLPGQPLVPGDLADALSHALQVFPVAPPAFPPGLQVVVHGVGRHRAAGPLGMLRTALAEQHAEHPQGGDQLLLQFVEGCGRPWCPDVSTTLGQHPRHVTDRVVNGRCLRGILPSRVWTRTYTFSESRKEPSSVRSSRASSMRQHRRFLRLQAAPGPRAAPLRPAP